MDATPRLAEIADAFAAVQLEAILIGNAGAALHGAPVTTLDFDFLYRTSPANLAKLQKVADLLAAQITQPFPSIPSQFQILRPNSSLQVDVAGRVILVASLADIAQISKNKKPRKPTKRELALEAMRQVSEQELTDMIRRQLALPMHERTHFLRVRLPNGGSCL